MVAASAAFLVGADSLHTAWLDTRVYYVKCFLELAAADG